MRKLLFLVLALAFVFALPAAAQEEGDAELPDFIDRTECEVDLSGETIPLYHFGDISQAYAAITQPLLTGIADAMDYFNARGGVCGADLEQINRDTENNPDQTQAIYDDFATRDPEPLLFVLYSSPDSEQLRDQLAEDEIPVLISAGSVEGLYGEGGDEPGWIFATNPLYIDQLGMFCEYVGSNPDSFPESPTIGYISWPGAFGEAAFTEEGIAYCESQGVGFIENPELFLPTATDVFTQVQNLVDQGANILYTNTLASGPPVIARTIVELGLENDVVLGSVNWGMDSSAGLIDQQTRGENGLPALDGMYGSFPFSWFTETNIEGIAFLNEQFAFYAEEEGRSGEDQLRLRNISYVLGWTVVDLYIELLTQTANRIGAETYTDMTGADVYETLQDVNYNAVGIQQIDFEDGELRDVELNRIVQYGFLNAEGTGPAASGAEADVEGGFFKPIIVPLMEFEDTPDLRPGMMEMEEEE